MDKSKKKKQQTIFHSSKLEKWREEWQDMPEFIQKDLTPFKTLSVHFEKEEDMKNFSKLINQKLTNKTKSIWYPKCKRENLLNKICSYEP